MRRHHTTPARAEPLECRRLLSAAPGRPDLVATSDSGASDADDVTNFNNATPARALQFLVRDVTPGALVTLYFDGQPAGGATAAGPSVLLTADAALRPADGPHVVTVRQTEAASAESGDSAPLAVTIDTTAPAAGGVAGTLDAGFAEGGRWLLEGAEGRDLLTQPDGRILAAAERGGQVVVARLNPDGSYDRTFGGPGANGLAVVPGLVAGAYLALQPDGRIIVGGTSAIARLLASGVPDPSFGVGGVVAPLPFAARDLGLGADGKVVVAGGDAENTQDRYGVARFNPDGSRDATFGPGGTGVAVTSVGVGGYGLVTALRVTPDGGVLVAGGASAPGGTSVVCLVRYTPGGVPDPGFGANGIVTTPVFAGASATDVLRDADGNVVIAGNASERGYNPPAYGFVARYRPDGTLDGSFGAGGVATTLKTGFRLSRGYLVPAPDGGYFYACSTFDPLTNRDQITLVRLRPDGRLDTSFGAGGAVAQNDFLPAGLASTTAQIWGAAAPGGQVLVSARGYGSTASPYWGVYRLHGATRGVPDLAAASDGGASDADDVTNDSTPTFDVSLAEPAVAFFRLYRNDVPSSGGYESAGAFTAGPQPDGTWTYAATVVDRAGNESPRGPALTVTIDTVAPKVDGVLLAGSAWSAGFLNWLAAHGRGAGGAAGGFLVPGGTAQPQPLPWANVNRVRLRFTEALAPGSLGASSLGIAGRNVARYALAGDGFALDASALVASWSLAGGAAFGLDAVRLTLPSAGLADLAGNALDGDWADGSQAFPSGDGAAGGDFGFRLNVVPGDADRNGRVDAFDMLGIKARRGANATTNVANYSVFYDLDGNSRIDAFDMLGVKARLGIGIDQPAPTMKSLLDGQRVAPAAAVNAGGDDDDDDDLAALLA